MDFKNRTMQEIWEHHGKSLAARDVNEFIKDFSDDVIFINNPNGGHAQGVFTGQKGVAMWCKEFFTLFGKIQDFVVADTYFKNNIVVVEWEINSETHRCRGGVDTFIVEDGRFKIVTVVYQVAEKGA